MVVKWGRNGEFIACPSYPECKNTKNFKRDDKGEIEIAVEEEVDEACEKCGKPMLLRFGKFGKFLGCSGYPDCKNIQPAAKAGGSRHQMPGVQRGQHQRAQVTLGQNVLRLR